jgi:hypothetical protein
VTDRIDIDLRDKLGPDVLDQENRPLCVTFAVSAAHEAHHSLADAEPGHLAPEAIWWHCTSLGQTSAAGMLLLDADSALRGPGQPGLADWPYNPALGSGTEDPPATITPPWNRAQLTPLTLNHDGSEDSLEESLEDGVPVVLVIEVTDEFRLPDAEGVIAVPDLRVDQGGYHAVVCVGAFTHPVHGRLLLIKNSWGTAWAVDGYGWLPVDYLIAFAAQAATVRNEGTSS